MSEPVASQDTPIARARQSAEPVRLVDTWNLRMTAGGLLHVTLMSETAEGPVVIGARVAMTISAAAHLISDIQKLGLAVKTAAAPTLGRA